MDEATKRRVENILKDKPLDFVECGTCGFVFFVFKDTEDPLYCPRCRNMVTWPHILNP